MPGFGELDSLATEKLEETDFESISKNDLIEIRDLVLNDLREVAEDPEMAPVIKNALYTAHLLALLDSIGLGEIADKFEELTIVR